MIASLSGIRGVYNLDLTPSEAAKFAKNFGRATGSRQFLLARDTRTSGPAMSSAVAAGLLSLGATVYDYGVITTPAIFRESRRKKLPAVMVTASHNEPEYSGLKFIVDGAGIGEELFENVVPGPKATAEEFGGGSVRRAQRSSYVEDLLAKFGARSTLGVKVAADFGGGAATVQASSILTRIGCDVTPVNDSDGVFARRIDPVADDLALLRRTVREKRCAIGLGFDCDGDRLVIVDSDGEKRTGDHMLTLALSALLARTGERRVVVSLDTTQAVDDVAEKFGCRVFRSRVGEANVVAMMKAQGALLGGEGSSGGLIDGSFNYCRDSMLAALAIIRELGAQGEKFYTSVPAYHQTRMALQIPKAKAQRALQKLAGEYEETDVTDGLKVSLPKKSWVLVRPSGTEDLVRVSAESKSGARARDLAASFARKLKGLSR